MTARDRAILAQLKIAADAAPAPRQRTPVGEAAQDLGERFLWRAIAAVTSGDVESAAAESHLASLCFQDAGTHRRRRATL